MRSVTRAGVEGQACGEVQQPVAQALGLAARELIGQQQALGPDDQVARDARDRQPDTVVRKVSEGHVAQAAVFVVADVVFGVGALALAALEIWMSAGLPAPALRQRDEQLTIDDAAIGQQLDEPIVHGHPTPLLLAPRLAGPPDVMLPVSSPT
jgi:hypothetical protein